MLSELIICAVMADTHAYILSTLQLHIHFVFTSELDYICSSCRHDCGILQNLYHTVKYIVHVLCTCDDTCWVDSCMDHRHIRTPSHCKSLPILSLAHQTSVRLKMTPIYEIPICMHVCLCIHMLSMYYTYKTGFNITSKWSLMFHIVILRRRKLGIRLIFTMYTCCVYVPSFIRSNNKY